MKIFINIIAAIALVLCGLTLYYLKKHDFQMADKCKLAAGVLTVILVFTSTGYILADSMYVDKFDEGIYTIDTSKFEQVCKEKDDDDLNSLCENLVHTNTEEFAIDRRDEELYIVIPKESYDESIYVPTNVMKVLEKENIISLIETKEID